MLKLHHKKYIDTYSILDYERYKRKQETTN